MIRIDIPYLPPKEFSRNSRVHWSVLHRVQDSIADDIHALLLESGWQQGDPWERAVVTIDFVLPDRRTRDADNLITSLKPIMDALTGRVYVDDSIKCIGIPKYHYSYSPKKEARTIIEIEQLPTE